MEAMEDTEPTDSEAMDEGSDGGTLSMAEGINIEKGMATDPSLILRRVGRR
jgi:hypothetical protein